jgi:hypothetical protein
LDKVFAKKTLKFFWRTNYASKGGKVLVTDSLFRSFADSIIFNTKYDKNIYSVEAPDGIEPADRNSRVIMRYMENNISGGIAYDGEYKVVIFGFPFETILSPQTRINVMKAIFAFFQQD